MLAATVRLQSPFSVVVFAPADRPEFWDLARDHYGSNAPMSAYDTFGQVIRAVAGGTGSVGVLPLPKSGEPDPWWPELLSTDNSAPRVVARLPFGARGNARDDSDALAIGCGGQQESGLDRTLLGAEFSAAISRPLIPDLLATAGLVCTFVACSDPGKAVYLIEVEGFVPDSDRRLDAFRAKLGVERLLPLGGYAVPLSSSALATKGPNP
jgi:hypothetical protein